MTQTLPPPSELLDLIPDAVCVVDAEGRFLYVSAAFERIFGYTRAEVVGRYVWDLLHPDDHAVTRGQAERIMAGELQRHFRNRYVHKDGHYVDIQWSARWHPEHGVRIATAREVTELRRAEQVLEHLASHDPLTGLANRLHFQNELKKALDYAQKTGEKLSLLYLDLDGFKQANDRGGHVTGDRVLCEVAGRLQKAIRQGDLLARIGGDEFVVLLPSCQDAVAARKVADTLRERLRSPFMLPDGELKLDASFGIANFPADGSDPNILLSRADQAMYAAKRVRKEGSHVTRP
ncbi:MAG: diguanylate cyclase [Thermomonas sp.]